ncbi:iron uptake transporter deferrochelatase/peroxidase subunit [Tomitella biformata]|uniref:iron uptake transporter deferrochelatase/peroxidase subunit n=1 Tax=Tomitella biformata TaxID=630403 RepID=UPI0004638DD0|nr:iron uptake transporter deferrochelatase/peroxidase subunit [Tomitella biformata]
MSGGPRSQAPSSQGPASQGRGVSRRGFLGGLGLTGAGLAVGAAAGASLSSNGSADESAAVTAFHGDRQAGITTPAQQRMMFGAFDVAGADKAQLRELLSRWSAAAALMTRGLPVGPTEAAPGSPPVDTGEAVGLGPGGLTITVGFGASLFDGRFGLADHLPDALAPLPPLPGDTVLDPAISGGDLCVQACASDPQVAFHVLRNFARMGRGTVTTRWMQEGFGRASSTSADQKTPRNLFGFKDGTNNTKTDDEFRDWVWVDDSADQPWMQGGSYLVTRKIAMSIETWDSDAIADQERVFGRVKGSGAPLGHTGEFDEISLTAPGPDGTPAIDPNSHVALAHPDNNAGVKLLRRSYNYTGGINPATGHLDAGLFFIAYQRDPHTQFAALQRQLGRRDNLNEYIKHLSSSVFACPPGVRGGGDYWGSELLA